ncbi:Mediator of RNA polymerase II transcription subunit 7 [Cladobotryum mycophilum]|uniref:Mediator of RNA polymerase II transcription subunit 7 n=1 Tax=Cladobotryum mycophilum TaxID=491253 RepID=A0ABR0SWJ1_9HYPO
MAEQEPHSLASTFPNPPPFWQEFTPGNVARIEELRRAHSGSKAGANEANGASVRIPDVPEDLICLQPPPEPADGKWRVFGDQYMLDDKLPTLEEQGIENLPASGPSDAKDAKHYDRAFELKRLAKSLLLNFLELAGVMGHSPSHGETKINDLRTLFINMHHIINEYRPHQARESAIEMMQDHLDKTHTETIAIRTQVDKARRVLEGLGSLGITNIDDDLGRGRTEEEEREAQTVEREADVWSTTDALFT